MSVYRPVPTRDAVPTALPDHAPESKPERSEAPRVVSLAASEIENAEHMRALACLFSAIALAMTAACAWVMFAGGVLFVLSLGSLLALALVSIWSNEATSTQVSR